jgi:solute:Na+ symporter, SSS family
VIRPFAPKLGDKQFLLLLRVVLLLFTTCALLFALNSTSTMYEMVQNAYNVTLAGAFIPLLAGAYWKKATTQGALFSSIGGVSVWLIAHNVAPEALIPANLIGFFASIVLMALGSLMPQVIKNQGEPIPR